jgi:hypothetical protein
MDNRRKGKPRDRTKCAIQNVVTKQKNMWEKKMADTSNNICDTMEFDRKDNTGGTPHKDQGRYEDARNNKRKSSHSTIWTP